MQVGDTNYNETPLPGSEMVDTITLHVPYTPPSPVGMQGVAKVEIVRTPVFRALFSRPGELREETDAAGKVIYHMKEGAPVKPRTYRTPDVVEEGLYHFLPVGTTGILQIVRLDDNWKELRAAEQNRVASTSNDGIAAELAAIRAEREAERAAASVREARISAALKSLGVREEDLGLVADQNRKPDPKPAPAAPSKGGQGNRA